MVNTPADRSPQRARQDYLKVIYQLGQRSPVRAAQVARHLRVTRASVSKFRRSLERDGLIRPAKGRTDAFALTSNGLAEALSIVRRHRLVETWLHDVLGVPLAKLHVEAERIEHALSDEVADLLARHLGHPSADPHGHRIPYGRGRTGDGSDLPLARARVGGRIAITSIEDRDDRVVRQLERRGMLPGTRAIVVENSARCVKLRVRDRIRRLTPMQAAGIRCAAVPRRLRA